MPSTTPASDIVVPLSRLQQPRDTLGRAMHDLRISVMDRCNFRCPYCMPREKFHEKYPFMRTAERLSFEEIVRLARLFVPLGVRKLRLTGGEPLLRANLPDLVCDLNSVGGIEDVALTTNGVLLAQHAAELEAAGLKRVTVSLDSLDPEVFRKMNGGMGVVEDVLSGIEHARRAGLEPIKINAVVQRGLNDHTALDLVERFRGTGVIVRFIEYMDVGNRNDWRPELVMPSKELAARINARWPIEPLRGELPRRSRGTLWLQGRQGRNRVHLVRHRSPSAGIARVRAFRRMACSTRACSPPPARACETFCAVAPRTMRCSQLLRNVWLKRGDRYSELRADLRQKAGNQPKIEMYYIGG